MLSAAPGRPSVVLTQPDGTTIEARISGDEFMKIITDTKGHALIKDADGFWYYAKYDFDGKKTSTGYKAGSNAPAEVLSASTSIPYASLGMTASAERQKIEMIRSTKSNIFTKAASSGIVPLAQGSMPSKKNCLVILAEFTDIPFTYGRDGFERIFNEKGYSYPLKAKISHQWHINSYLFKE